MWILMNESTESEIFVSAVRFADNAVQIDFYESRKQSPVAAIGETMMIDVDYIKDEAQELQEFLVDLLDKGHILIRNPPKRLKPKGMRLADEAVDDDEGSV